MKQVLSLVLPIVWLMGSIGSHAQADVPGCTAAQAVYFQEYLYPVFEDYTALREAFVAEGNFGQVGGELIGLRAQLDEVLQDSPTCLDGVVLDLALSMANLQTGILFLILSFEMDDPALAERFQQMGLYYTSQSDRQYVAAAEVMGSFAAKRLTIEGDLDAGTA
jgi:hypothetical protein